MNRKTILRILLLMGIGGVIGLILSFGLMKLNQYNHMKILEEISDFFIEYTVLIYIVLFVCLFLPAVFQYIKAKKNYDRTALVSDDEIDTFESKGEYAFQLSMLINGVFLILNLMLFGMTFNRTRENLLLVLFLFLFSSICAAVLEIIAIRYIQEIDNRLKGKPTSLKFNKEFLESCDEAEKFRIYKSGYHAFQFSRNASLGLIVLTILCNIVLSTGVFPVFVSCMIMLIQITSYNYYTLKTK
ncbi:DUF3169 family protein [Sporosalibacterium faouarense]|uniref:DUF3169 family protein n=1 Tax=Sporosalibacterium faouarense TaxID=516123 RepID=UPI00192AC5B9|nr:DUF3169 family protein [Sporosalibacterium faouarense]